MYWIIGFLVISIAFLVIKFMVNKAVDPDSQLGILEHPSMYKKPDIEMVDTKGDDSIKANKEDMQL